MCDAQAEMLREKGLAKIWFPKENGKIFQLKIKFEAIKITNTKRLWLRIDVQLILKEIYGVLRRLKNQTLRNVDGL